ncbi:hypothetical protein ASB57_03295 [Bordetella sp. N]|nr:hypothetical protein ASB57_03295 [Bordetella sp. N]
MATNEFPLPVEVDQSLLELGQRISFGRRLRALKQSDVARQAGVGVSSIVALEQGAPGVAIGTLARVLWALDSLSELDQVATVDASDPLVTSRVDTVPQRIRQKKGLK